MKKFLLSLASLAMLTPSMYAQTAIVEGPEDGCLKVYWQDVDKLAFSTDALWEDIIAKVTAVGVENGNYTLSLGDNNNEYAELSLFDETTPNFLNVNLNVFIEDMPEADSYILTIPANFVILDGQIGNPEPVEYTFNLDEEEDPYWYIQASFNGFNPNGEEKYALMDDEKTPGIYSGLFEVPAGEFKFNLISGQGMIFVPSTGGEDPLETTETIEFQYNKFEGLLINAYPGYEDNYWVCKNWDGGSIQVWVDANEGVIEVYAFPSSVASDTIKGEISGPEDGLITITYECEWIERGTASYENGNAYLLEADGNKIELSYGSKEYAPIYIDGNETTLVIDLEYINLLPGNYTLVLAEGYLNVVDAEYDDYDSAAVSFEFTYGTVGINNISSEEGEYNVIGINGAKVLNTKDPNKLRNLSNGVYIINGKKVMIRK